MNTVLHGSSCTQCGKPLTPNRLGRKAKFCSGECRKKHIAARYREANPVPTAPISNIGAVSELRVSIDLLQRGYHVFRALSGSALVDLAILKDGKLITVEVTTGHCSAASGKITHPSKDLSRFDVLAVVLPNRIIYTPEGILTSPSTTLTG